eukprot:scaffold12.g8030.t1
MWRLECRAHREASVTPLYACPAVFHYGGGVYRGTLAAQDITRKAWRTLNGLRGLHEALRNDGQLPGTREIGVETEPGYSAYEWKVLPLVSQEEEDRQQEDRQEDRQQERQREEQHEEQREEQDGGGEEVQPCGQPCPQLEEAETRPLELQEMAWSPRRRWRGSRRRRWSSIEGSEGSRRSKRSAASKRGEESWRAVDEAVQAAHAQAAQAMREAQEQTAKAQAAAQAAADETTARLAAELEVAHKEAGELKQRQQAREEELAAQDTVNRRTIEALGARLKAVLADTELARAETQRVRAEAERALADTELARAETEHLAPFLPCALRPPPGVSGLFLDVLDLPVDNASPVLVALLADCTAPPAILAASPVALSGGWLAALLDLPAVQKVAASGGSPAHAWPAVRAGLFALSGCMTWPELRDRQGEGMAGARTEKFAGLKHCAASQLGRMSRLSCLSDCPRCRAALSQERAAWPCADHSAEARVAQEVFVKETRGQAAWASIVLQEQAAWVAALQQQEAP